MKLVECTKADVEQKDETILLLDEFIASDLKFAEVDFGKTFATSGNARAAIKHRIRSKYPDADIDCLQRNKRVFLVKKGWDE